MKILKADIAVISAGTEGLTASAAAAELGAKVGKSFYVSRSHDSNRQRLLYNIL